MAQMLDVARWLADHGLGQHAKTFAKHGVGADVLRDLTDADLKEIGLNLGDRKRVLKAIATLGVGLTQVLAEEAESSATPAVPREAERRQLTVMFIDLVGSTELSARLDPEDLGVVMRIYQNRCADVIARWDGYIARLVGDGVLAYFGWPQAHENDAERAVRAGLEMVAEVGTLTTPSGEALAARIGLATGLAVVGDLVGAGLAREEGIVGETPNVAARLQTLASPGSVVISQTTRRLVGGLFELTDLGPTPLKGFAEPLTAFRVEGESRVEGRFEALHGGQLTPLVGREHELAMLMERFACAKDGEGQVVLLAGEAGIGKSRLVRALRESLAGEPHFALSHFCSPYHSNSALYPVIAQLERAAGFVSADQAEAKLAKLEALLGHATTQVEEALHLIAALLGVPSDARYRALNLSPQRQKQRTLEVLIEQVAGLAHNQPVLALYEDVHWADPSTLELLDLLVQRLHSLPVLVLLTYRPEFSPPWSGQAHVTALTISRLGRRQGAVLVDGIAGGKALPVEVLDQILAKTDGVPLFVEELTRTVLESGLLTDAGDDYKLAGPLPALAIPATLHDSLMARLDRLAPVKYVAQIGAVIGREFSHELLAAVADRPQEQLNTALDQLVSSELMLRRGTSPAATYSFKHALVQDVAYQSLLKFRREQLHSRIAQTLISRFPARAEVEPELIARHYTEAGLARQAIIYWERAGHRAYERSSYIEATRHLHAGLALLERLPAGPERSEQELRLQTALAGACLTSFGFIAQETGTAYSRAWELCRELGSRPEVFPVLRGLHTFQTARGDHLLALNTAKECLNLASEQNDTESLSLAHRLMSWTMFLTGEFTCAKKHLENTLALYEPAKHERSAVVFGLDSKSVLLSYLAPTLFILGFGTRSLECSYNALEHARKLGYAFNTAYTTWLTILTNLYRREYRLAQEQASLLLAYASEHSLPGISQYASAFHGWALAGTGDMAAAIVELKDSIGACRSTGALVRLPVLLGVLSEALSMSGQRDEAFEAMDEALTISELTGERAEKAELYRLIGDLHLRAANPGVGQAVASFQRALDIARHQQAKSWELRAAMSLARLWADQGKRAEARDLLAPTYGWFTEGFDTADLKDAKALLDALA